jgi:hypothetical protein
MEVRRIGGAQNDFRQTGTHALVHQCYICGFHGVVKPDGNAGRRSYISYFDYTNRYWITVCGRPVLFRRLEVR